MNIAVIPARGGSKRIPRKNVRPFFGRPMIAWSISAALDSGCFDRVIVSTDDDEIAEVARSEGAEVPFRRPAELSDDHTPTIPVITHALAQLDAGISLGHVCCIYATAPFLQPGDLQAARVLIEERGCDYVFSVTRYDFPIQRALRLDCFGFVSMLQPEHSETRSQDLEEAYHDAGQFYWGKAEAWAVRRPIMGSGAVGFPLPRTRVQDIDTMEDWERAEQIFSAMRGG